MSDIITDISLILKDLLKVIKVVSMYPENNPLPQSLKRSFSEKLVNIVEEYGDLKIGVDKSVLTFNNEVVFSDKSKEESLAIIFFRTGITNFTFKAGLDVNEVYTFLDVLKEHLNSQNKNQDLVAMIWESGISRFSFTTVEDVALSEYDGNVDFKALAEKLSNQNNQHKQFSTDNSQSYSDIFSVNIDNNYVSLDDSSDIDIPDNRTGQPHPAGQKQHYAPRGNNGIAASVFGGDSDEVNENSLNAVEAAQAMGFGDIVPQTESLPDTTIILNKEFELSKEAEEKIVEISADDVAFDIYESTLELLKEMLHQETETVSFNETVTICEKILNEFIQAGKFLEASQLFKYLQAFGKKIKKKKPMWSERINDAIVTIGSRERLKVLTDTLNENPEIGSGMIKIYLSNFDWQALSGLTDLLGDLKHETHQEALCNFLALMGKDNLHIISKGLQDKRIHVVKNSVTVMAHINNSKAFSYLHKLTNHHNSEVRITLARALKDNPNETAIDILKNLAIDEDAAIRREAVQSISQMNGQKAFEAITDIINNDKFENLEQPDQQSLLNAFSLIGGDKAVTYLSQLISNYNITGNSTLKFFRSAAFEALTINKSEKAEKVLIKLSNSWRPDIKNLAQHALHQRRSNIYGGEHE